MAKHRWKLDVTMQFIQCYKLNECLWNFSSPDYKNKSKRNAALNAIVKEMNIDNFGVQEVKNKINNLRSTYNQEVKKVKDSKKSGVGLNRVYVSNIKWLKEMDEIFAIEPKKNTHENIESVSQMLIQQVKQEDGTQSFHAQERNSQPILTDTTTKTTATASRHRDIIVKANNDLKTMHARRKIEGEQSPFDIFGKSVAIQLKTLSIEKALLAQQKIQCILTEIGIADYREKAGNNSSISNYSDEPIQSSPTIYIHNDSSQ